MRKDIKAHIDICHTCSSTKGFIHVPVPMLNYPTPAGPWDTIAVDLLKLPITRCGNQYLFVATDNFSRFSVLVPLPDKSAQIVARALLDNVICLFTTPKVLLSDNGKELINDVLQSLCQLFHVKKCNILPFRPSSNSVVERHNWKILNTLRSLIPDNDTLWDTYTSQVMTSLNSTINKSISETPHYIIFLQNKRLPYDVLSQSPAPVYNLDDYVKVKVSTFQKIHQRIQQSLVISKAEMLLYHNKSASNFSLNIGDIVYSVKHVKTSKLNPNFEGTFRVIAKETGNKVRLLNLSDFLERVSHLDSLKRVSSGLDYEKTSLHSTPFSHLF